MVSEIRWSPVELFIGTFPRINDGIFDTFFMAFFAEQFQIRAPNIPKSSWRKPGEELKLVAGPERKGTMEMALSITAMNGATSVPIRIRTSYL